MNQNPIFVAIERCCKECVTEPKVDSFISLKNIINCADHEILEPIQKFISFPLHRVLNEPSSSYNEALIIETCLCLIGLFEKKIVIKTFTDFAEVYISLFLIIDDRLRSEKGQKPASEDLKMTVVETVYELIKSTPNNVMDECYSHEVFSGVIRNSVGVLLTIIKNEKSKSLKISGIKTLEIMMKRSQELDEEGVENVGKSKTRCQLFSSFLPGITVSIVNLITSDDKHPHALIIASLETLSLAIQLSFPYSSNKNTSNQKSSNKNSSNKNSSTQEDGSTFNSRLQEGNPSESVIEETGAKLNVALSRIINHLVSNPSFRVRLALTNFTCEIFFKCDAKLVNLVSEKIIDVPLTYSCDGDVEVRSKASSSLSLIFKSCPHHILTSIQDVILTKLLSTCKIVRQNIDSFSSDEKVIQFKFLTGIFSSFQYQHSTFFQVPKNRNDVMRTLIHVSRFKSSSLVDVSKNLISENLTPFQFQYLESSKEVECFKELVKSVTCSCDQQMLIDYLIGNLRATRFNEQFAFISNEMIRNLNCDLSDDLLDIFKSCLEEEVLKSRNENVTTIRSELALEGVNIWSSNSVRFNSSEPSSETKERIIEDNKSKLLPVVYTILKYEKKEVHLNSVSEKLGYKNVNDMISKNVSYFCNKFQEETNLQHLTVCSLVLFRNLIHGSSAEDSFNEAKDSFNERFDVFRTSLDTLVQILDLNYNKSPRILLQILFTFTESVSKQFSSVEKVNNEHPVRDGKKRSEKNQPFCFKDSWFQYLEMVDVLGTAVTNDEQKLESDAEQLNSNGKNLNESHDATEEMKRKREEEGNRSNYTNDPEREEEEGNRSNYMSDPEREEESSEKKEFPVHVMMKKMLERSANLLTLPDPDDRLLILDMISNCVKILSVEENELLPLVHKMWPSLVNRLSDEIPIAKKSFQLILQLTSTCGDFVHRRVISDVFPKIIPFLKNHVSDGIKSRTRHPFTLVYRLQLDALIGIGTLAVGIDVQGKQLWNLMNVLLLYFTQNQPLALMEAAEKSLIQLRLLDSDAVWFYSKKILESRNVSSSDKLLLERLNEFSLENFGIAKCIK